MSLFFDARHLPQPANEYVAWVDVMGTQASMARSLKITANFIFKLHTAALQAQLGAVKLYPVMDGFYASSADKMNISDFLRNVFSSVADEFNSQKDNQHRFIIRGGMAFGPTVHGSSIPQQASKTMSQNGAYCDALLLGMPMVQAHLSESNAPPFGIFIHESARAFAPVGQEPFHHAWWRWDCSVNQKIWNDLKINIDDYFSWCMARSMNIGYDEARIQQHKKMASQLMS